MMNDDILMVIPDSARAVVACLPNPEPAADILFRHPGIRRIWIVCSSSSFASRFDGADSRMVFIPVPAGADAWSILAPALESDPAYFMEGRVAVCVSSVVRRTDPALAVAVEAGVLEHTRSVVTRGALRANRGWHVLMNSALNRSRAGGYSLAMLDGAWTCRPVVVVGAGPSLDRNVRDLISSRPNVMLIACDGALGTLARHELVPDLIVSIDDTEKVWRYFARLPGSFSDIPVACILQSSWPVVRHHAGPILFGRGQNPADLLLAGAFPVFDSGLCVGHAAFEAALLSGGSPIILIGFDLGYAGDRFHPEDMAIQYYHENPPPKSNLLFVPGFDGVPVRTDLSMAMYLREFERRFSLCGRTVIDATEGGALKRGTRIMRLKDALAAFCPDSISSVLPIGPSSATQWIPPPEWKIQSLCLADRLQNGRPDDPDFLAELAEGWRREPGFQSVLDLLSGAVNPFSAVAFRFAWEDWVRNGSGACLSRELIEAGAAYAGDLRICACFLAGLMELLSGIAWAPDSSRILCCGFNSGDCKSTAPLLAALQADGFECRPCPVAPDDLPGFWRHVRAERIGVVLQANGIIFPALWAVAGCVCLDWREAEPEPQVLVEPWLPGYAVVSPAPSPAAEWRRRLPPDRSVYSPVDGIAWCQGEKNRRVAWRELVHDLRKEIEPGSCMR